jgi:excisionase family DNA binding protein
VTDTFYTLPEVAARLKVSLRSVERYVAQKRLRAVELGPRTRRVRDRELGAFVAGNGRRFGA